MADDEVSVGPVDLGPVLMADALDRLRALRYEAQYCAPKDLAPFHSLQFAVPSANPSSQLSAFLGIVAWLLTEAKRPMKLDRLDDPTTAINKLLAELRALGAGSDVLDVSPVKLRSAAGEAACRILLFCADAALAAKGFKWSRPVYVEEPPPDEVAEEDDGGDTAGVDDEAAVVSDDDVEEVLYVASSSNYKGGPAAPGVLSANVDPAAWRAELERVAPRLRAPVPLGSGAAPPSGTGSAMGSLGGVSRSGGGNAGGALVGEWRGHLEATQAADGRVGTLLPPAFSSLRRLASELNEVGTLVAAREDALNVAFSPLVQERGVAAAASAALAQEAATAQARVTGLAGELAALGEALDEVLAVTDERGSSIADASPLIRIKSALATVRADIKDLDVQLGVQGHAVMQERLSARHAAHEKAREAADGGRR